MNDNSLAGLLDLSSEFERELVESEGEITPELEQRLGLAEMLTSDKVDATEYVIKNLEAQAAFLKERAQEFLQAARARANAAERIRDRVKTLMLIHEKSELAGEYVRFVVSPSQPSLVIEDETKIPQAYIKTITTEKIDNASIKAALQGGIPVSGAHLTEGHQLRTYPAVKRLGRR